MTQIARGGLTRVGSVAWSVLGIVLLVLLAGWAVGRLMSVVLPIAVAVLLATLLKPIAYRLECRGMRPAAAASIAVLIAVLALCALIALILPPFIARLADLGTSVQEGVQRVAYSLGESVAGMSRAEVDKQLDSAANHAQERLGGTAMAASTSLAGALASIVLIVFLSFFIVKDGRRMWVWMLELLPSARRGTVDEVGFRMWRNLTAYTRGVVFVATVDAVLIGVVLLILGIPLALPLIVLTWLAAFFPIIGAIAAGAAAVLVAMVTGGTTDALIVLATIIVVQQVEGNVLYPVVVGPRLKLHPVAVLVSVAAGGTLAGIAGAFLAVPVATAASAVVGHLREQRALQEQLIAPAPRRGVMVGNGTT
ncbi:AI-2E family transporter [Solirubrobacter pauli]|uniref:AI-2E family transporter n=1 Tax=Solirubrobacter pauli TaxID=166793 RepID=UPI00147699D0|nr:AI-2E family transporter [Solirubrobacter pauli]